MSGERCASDAGWWRQAVVYQIYPRSFADANGDGIGDLAGIRSRIDHLSGLGVDAVWISPFYPSGLADGGYDISDHCDVDARIGTLDEFDVLVDDLHAAGIRVIIDIVPNHTSDQHPWFREALASPPGSAARGRYHFLDGLGPDGSLPPSDWRSIFGGSTWTRVPDGQWYLHTFAPEQPDLNWDDESVREGFLDILRFWADRGVDGFRVDAAKLLVKDMSLPLPSQAELDAEPLAGPHRLEDRDELFEVYRQWRRVFNSYDPPRAAVAEAAVPTQCVPRYASAETLGQSFFFDLQLAEYDASTFRRVIDECFEVAGMSGSSATWVLNNHDTVRSASRYGTVFPGLGPKGDPVGKYGGDWLQSGGDPVLCDAARGLRRARAATLLVLALPGSAYLYQGEELGLQEVAEIPADRRQDPTFFWRGDEEVGRDGCRVPLPWEPAGPSYGFGSGGAHLPQPLWFGHYAVSVQDGDPDSTLNLYRAALRQRRRMVAERGEEPVEWVATGREDVLALRRGPWLVVSNFGEDGYAFPAGEVVVSSEPVGDEVPGETTVWLRV